MKRYYGNYLGIVVDDTDPLFKNRVKIYIPTVSHTILGELHAKVKNIKISQMGFNIKNHVEDKIYEDLRRALPWAECAVPLFGGGTSLHYNQFTKKSTNKHNIGSLEEKDILFKKDTKKVIHPDLTTADSRELSVPGSPVDLFNNEKMPDLLNENAFNINSAYTSIIPGGMFSTPKINSHVWVFFNDGDPQYPIYFAHHIVYEDWQRIKQTTETYNLQSLSAISPSLEDIDTSKDTTYTVNFSAVGGPNADLYKDANKIKPEPPTKNNSCDDNSKTVLSTLAQPGAGLIEFITYNFKDKNIIADEGGIKISTPGGGMFSIMTGGTTEYAAVNKTVKVGGSCFLTVENHKETTVEGSATNIINEDLTQVVGKTDTSSVTAVQALREIYREVATEYIDSLKKENIKRVKCPICWSKTIDDSGTYEISLQLRDSRKYFNLWPDRDSVGIRSVLSVLDVLSVPGKEALNKDIHNSPSCGNPNCINNEVIEYNVDTRSCAAKSVQKLKQKHEQIVKYEEEMGIGGNKVEIISKNKTTKVGLLYNDIYPYAKIENAFPIKNGIDFFDKKGISPHGDAIDIFRDADSPGLPTGICENFIGTKYTLLVGSKGINIQTSGNVLLQGGNVNISGNSITLNNNTGLTKINGAAVIVEATKSITLGTHPTNVHVNGSLHASGNITAQGSIFSNNNIYAKRLVIPSSIQKTDTSSNVDFVTGIGIQRPEAAILFTKDCKDKLPKHYNTTYHGRYLATELGLLDLTFDWITADYLGAADSGAQPEPMPAGMNVGGSGIGVSMPEYHIHLLHNAAHEHSFRGPNSFYLNNQDEIYNLAATTGTVIPDIN